MRITKHNFNTPAVTVGTNHYFPSEHNVFTMPDGTISMAVCYYSQTRRKWLQDTAYLSPEHAKDIIDYAIKRELLSCVPAMPMAA